VIQTGLNDGSQSDWNQWSVGPVILIYGKRGLSGLKNNAGPMGLCGWFLKSSSIISQFHLFCCVSISFWANILFSFYVHSHVAEHANCDVRKFLEAAKHDISPQGDWVGSVRTVDRIWESGHLMWKQMDLKKYHDIFKFLGHMRLLSRLWAECHIWASPELFHLFLQSSSRGLFH